MYTPATVGLPAGLVLDFRSPGCPSSESGPGPEPPSAQSPFARLGSYPRRRDVQHLVGGRYPSFLAHTGSCARPKSSLPISFSLYGRSLQVAVSPCWKLALPDVISTVCVKAPGPIPRRAPDDPVRLDVLATAWTLRSQDIGLASVLKSSARENLPAMQLPQGGSFRGCSHSLMFRLLYSLGPPVAPTTVLSTGQPGRLHHAMNMWLPALSIQGFT